MSKNQNTTLQRHYLKDTNVLGFLALGQKGNYFAGLRNFPETLISWLLGVIPAKCKDLRQNSLVSSYRYSRLQRYAAISLLHHPHQEHCLYHLIFITFTGE